MPIDDKKKKLIKEYLKETSPKELIFHEINNLNKDLTVIKDSLSKIDDFLGQLNGITDEELTEALEELRSEFRDELSKIELKHGEDGYTPRKDVDYFDGKDGKDGKDGIDGKDGEDGYTPIRGKDYFTDEDINLISLDVQSQLRPLFDIKIKTSDIEDLDEFAEELKGSIEKRAIDILDQRTQFLINKQPRWGNIVGSVIDQQDLVDYIATKFVSVSSNTTLDNTNEVVEVTASATITLPTAVGITGKTYIIKNTSGTNIIIDANGVETIDGHLSIISSDMESYQLISNGSNWLVI